MIVYAFIPLMHAIMGRSCLDLTSQAGTLRPAINAGLHAVLHNMISQWGNAQYALGTATQLGPGQRFGRSSRASQS